MKRAYFVFALLLVMLLVIFLVVRNYVSMQADVAEERETRDLVTEELDKLQITVDSRLDAAEQRLLAKFDSLVYSLDEPLDVSAELDTLDLDTLADGMTGDTLSPSDTSVAQVAPEDTTAADTTIAADTTVLAIPTEQDNEIYIRYLKKRWALPGDLTKYQLAAAKQEIMTEVGADYQMTADEVLAVIDKVYEYRKTQKANDN